MKLPKPFKKAMVYTDSKLYVCLANYPIVEGHTVIVWKKPVRDLHLLSRKDYLYLMDIVEITRNAILKTLGLKKVYLLYMDEINQVHWHLIPRYNKKGFDVFKHKPSKLQSFSIVKELKSNFIKKY
jgi:diadenosine tetraphosphate (Ap4A) HIT family hydrolase